MPGDAIGLPVDEIMKLADFICSGGVPTETLIPGERREVAIVFLDLCGFTELSCMVDAESLHRFVNGLMQALAGIVQSHGGYVDKFEGDRIMALFGATTSFENDCERAVLCAMRMQETVSDVAGALRERGIGLSARAGVGCGIVTVAPDPSGHLTATGEDVNIASRLEEVARPGSVLVSEKAWSRCPDLFEWEDLGGVMVRGVDRPVRSLRPTGPGLRQRRRWESAASLREAPLLGRGDLLGRIVDFLESPSEPPLNIRGGSRHRIVTVEGEPGAGKSRLLEEVAAAVSGRDGGAVVLRGEVSPVRKSPLRFWSTLASRSPGLQESGAEVPDSMVSNDLKAIASLCAGSLTSPGPGTDPESRRQPVVDALRKLLSSLAAAGRVILVADDLQEMDPESLQVMEFLLNNCDTAGPLMVLLGRRTGGEGSPRVHPNYSDARTFVLGPLSDGDMAEAVRFMLGASSLEEVPPSVVATLLARAGGNPRTVRELLRALVEGGFLERGPGGWVARQGVESLGLPSSLSAVLRSRIDRLPSRLRHALRMASVLGDEFPADSYSALALVFDPESRPDVDLAALVEGGFLERGTQVGDASFSFASPLLRLASYGTLLNSNRQLLHRRAAEITEDLHSTEGPLVQAEVARHLFEAGNLQGAAAHALEAARGHAATDDRRTVEMATMAARLLNRSGDPGRLPLLLEALMLMKRPIDASALPAEREAMLLGALRSCEEASLVDPAREVRRMLAGLYSSCGRAAEAEETYRKLLAEQESAEVSRHLAETRLDFAGHTVRYGRAGEGIEMLVRAASEFERMGMIEQVANALGNAGAAYLMRLRDPASARAYLERSLELYRLLGNPRGEATSLGLLGTMHGMDGRLDLSRSTLLEALRLWEELGSRRGQAQVLSNLGVCSLEAGLPDEAERYHRRALSLCREAGIRRGEAVALLYMGSLALQRGRRREAGELLDAALAAIRETGQRQFEMECLCHMGRLEIRDGDAGAAVRRYAEALSVAGSIGVAKPAAREILALREELLASGVDPSEAPVPVEWQGGGADRQAL